MPDLKIDHTYMSRGTMLP